MIKTYQKVIVYKKTISGWDFTTPITLTSNRNIKAEIGTGSKKDSFSFDHNNANGRTYRTKHSGDGSTTTFLWEYGTIPVVTNEVMKVYLSEVLQTIGVDYVLNGAGTGIVFNTAPPNTENNIVLEFTVVDIEDIVRIYFRTGDNSFTDDDVVMEGFVRNLDRSRRKNINGTKVSGVGMIEALFGILTFALNPDKPATNIIQDILSQINNLVSPLRTFTWNPANDVTTTNVDYVSKYETARKLIEDLATEPVNKEGYYFYSITKDFASNTNYLFNFKKKGSGDSQETVILGGVKEPLDVKAAYNTEAINAVIFNAGYSPYGTAIEGLHFNRDKGIAGSVKWKYISTYSDTANKLIDSQFANNVSAWDTTGTDGYKKYEFPKSASYPYTLTFYRVDRNGEAVTPAINTVANDDEFNEAIVNKARQEVKEKVQNLLDQGEKRKEIVFYKQLTSIKEFALGGLIEYTDVDSGLKNALLRITQLTYELNKVKLSCIEDELTVR